MYAGVFSYVRDLSAHAVQQRRRKSILVTIQRSVCVDLGNRGKDPALSPLVRMSADDVRRVQDEGLALFRRKNADYGNAYKHYGAVGVIVRMGDKIQRMASITSREVRLVNDESLRDTLLDLHNYAAMAIALLDDERRPSIAIPGDQATEGAHAPGAPTHKQGNAPMWE